MSMNKPDIEQIQRAVATSLHEHWVLFLVEGIILIILGLAAVVIPPIATLAVEILYGWLFLISGIVGLITTVCAKRRVFVGRSSRRSLELRSVLCCCCGRCAASSRLL
jgi:uncharacterized membrane protein HdeD (DUF308 family)